MKKYASLICFYLFSSTLSAAEVEARLGWANIQQYGFAVNGIVERVDVQEGDKLEKGDRLAQLDLRPFQYKLKRCRAHEKKNAPAIFDAKLDFDHAEELYERTVLSEVELQRIESRYKALLAEQEAIKAECQVESWHLQQATLTARDSIYVTGSSIVPGMVISDENKSIAYIETASTSQASATVLLSAAQKSQLKLSRNIEVVFPEQNIPAKVHSMAIKANQDQLYPVVFIFHYRQPVEPDKTIRVRF